jgi:hypothetical protein
VPMVFMSVLRATIKSFGDAGFGLGSWPNAIELAAIKASAKHTPPIDNLGLDIGASLLWGRSSPFFDF